MGSTLLKLQRIFQKKGECAVAAAATVANYYNDEITYQHARELAQPDGQGMYTPEIGVLLNQLGFRKVTIVSADIRQFDFKWAGLSKTWLLKHLARQSRYGEEWETRQISRLYKDFLADQESQNKLIIDRHFGEYIRGAIDQGKPLLLNFNFNLFFNYPKKDDNNRNDPFRGDYSEHEVACAGYDDEGVFIVDSHHHTYRGKLARYHSGRYKMDWETLHTVMGFGDVVIPEKYSLKRAKEYECVSN